MATPRPPSADIMRDEAERIVGVLVCRVDDEARARAMARRAMEVDLGWSPERAEDAMSRAWADHGLWRKVPDRNGPGWLLARAGNTGERKAGASQGIYWRFTGRVIAA